METQTDARPATSAWGAAFDSVGVAVGIATSADCCGGIAVDGFAFVAPFAES